MPSESLKKARAALATTVSWKRPSLLILAFALQLGAAVFFLFDSVAELMAGVERLHALTEVPVAIALCIGGWLTIRELNRLIRANAAQDRALSLVGEAFLALVENRFGAWNLTLAERDVAWLSLRGKDVAEIARLRNAAAGTVRAQMAKIYGKAGVTNRTQFVALFVDQLMWHLPDRLDQPQGRPSQAGDDKPQSAREQETQASAGR